MAESAKAKKAPQELTEKQLRFRRLAAQGAREGAVIALIALSIPLNGTGHLQPLRSGLGKHWP